MSRIERQIIVWAEDRRCVPAPRYDYGAQPPAGLVAPGVRQDHATRATDLSLRIRELTEEILRLRAETDELRRMHHDLEASAEIWIEMYERQLARANELAVRLARSSI